MMKGMGTEDEYEDKYEDQDEDQCEGEDEGQDENETKYEHEDDHDVGDGYHNLHWCHSQRGRTKVLHANEVIS